jgi:hypothetical protein
VFDLHAQSGREELNPTKIACLRSLPCCLSADRLRMLGRKGFCQL